MLNEGIVKKIIWREYVHNSKLPIVLLFRPAFWKLAAVTGSPRQRHRYLQTEWPDWAKIRPYIALGSFLLLKKPTFRGYFGGFRDKKFSPPSKLFRIIPFRQPPCWPRWADRVLETPLALAWSMLHTTVVRLFWTFFNKLIWSPCFPNSQCTRSSI
jgi:hypothetical protein